MAIFTRPTREHVHMPTAPWPGSGGRPPGGWRETARALGRRWWWLALALVAVAGSLVGVDVASGSGTYPLTAVFARAPGLFPGADVEVLGVPVGTVTSVRPVGDEVRVGLAVDHGRAVPTDATASLVSPELLGEPSIELAPAYTGGPSLGSGSVIPLSRTAVPVSTEQMLKALYRTLQRVKPGAVGSLVTNLAQDLQGQGKGLQTLISGAAGTLKLLATKADTLGQLSGSLAQLTGTLDARSQQITQLITDYDTVSAVIAQHSSQLGGAVVQLSEASTQLVRLLVPNLGPLETDVGTVTTVGRTLDRNLTSVDETLASATDLFAGAGRAYTPAYNWLTLNSQLPPGLTAAILANQVRDRLAGVCRRVLAHHAAGLSAAQVKTLETCGNPGSAFFDAIVSQIPTVLNDVRTGTLPKAPTPAQMLQQGLAAIPGVPKAKPPTPSTPSKKGTKTGGSKGSLGGTTTTTGSGSTTPTTTKTCLGGLLGGLLTCTSKSSSTTTPTATGSKGGTGLGGLLSYDVPSTPSLTPPAARYLPPLPASAPGGRHAARPRHRSAHRRGSRRARDGGAG